MPESSREEIAKLEALYANNPAGRVFTHLAEAYRKAGELERARGILDEGLQKHPGYASAYVVLGRVLVDLQENDDATSAFRQVLDLDPHNLVALRSLGDLARGAGRTEEAVQYFEELRQHDPGNDEIEQIITALRSPEQPPAATDEPPSPEEFEARSVTTEFKAEPSEPEWRPEPTFYEPEHFEPAEPATEARADVTPEPAPEPWAAAEWAPEKEVTPDVATPFDPGIATEEMSFGWVPDLEPQPEPEPTPDELGDLDSIGKATEVFDVVGDTFAPEEINLGVGEALIEQPGEAPEGEVHTETIAELYRKQGLYDRAAEVYRALLLERADDPSLLAKLAEVEALAQPPSPVSAAADSWDADEAEPEPETAPDVEEAAAWLAGGVGTAESPPTPYAWAEQPADVTLEAGRPIADYFRGLLAWQPRAVAVPSEEAAHGSEVPAAARAEAATAEEAFDEWFGAAKSASVEAGPERDSSAPPSTEQTAPEDGDDDDDLEMFRSWLQSLKK